MYTINVKRKVLKSVQSMPKARQKDFLDLVKDLKEIGPIQKGWSNFSSLDNKREKYHCHLSYHWVACWKVLKDKTMELEVYYAGSRENAPY